MNTRASGATAEAKGAVAVRQGAAPGADAPAAWLAFQCQSVPGVLSGVLVLGPPDAGPFTPAAFWPDQQGGAPRLAEIAEQALADRRAVIMALPAAPGIPARSFGIAHPFDIDGHLHGVVALELSERPEAELQLALRALQWAAAWVEARLREQQQTQAQSSDARLMAVLDLVASVLEEDRFEAACRSLVTELAMRLQCDRASLGVQRNEHAELVALSHSAQFGKRMNLVSAIGAAMDEAIDQKAIVRYPPAAEDEIVVTRDHEALATQHGSGAILTVPMKGGSTLTAALTLERPASMPFGREDIDLCQSVAAMTARILEVKDLNERGLWRHALAAGREQLQRLTGPRYPKRKIFAGAALLALVFFSFAKGDYRVTAPSTLEGAIRRSVAAPFDGYIAGAQLRAGDLAREGAVLATLDDRDLRLERMKWASQYAQYQKQHQEAVANRDRARAQIVEAMYDQAAAQVKLLDEQLSRAAVKAPFDGVVVKGDLTQALGSAVKRGDVLFELTPLDAYRVVVDVDEREIADVAVGQKGVLVLASIAGESFPFTVRTVTSVTTAREGRNYFRVEALLDKTGERLRPGMEGVGKIEIDRRRLIWIWTHKLVDWARLFIWTYLP
jgi:RND family efflux transporter MFP subunit